MYWSPQLLGRGFQEARNFTATRMHDLASEFSKNFPGLILPDPHSGRGRPLPAPNTQHGLWPARGASAPVLKPQPWPPSTFQPWLRPCLHYVWPITSFSCWWRADVW